MNLPENRFFVRKSAPLSEIDIENRRAAATGSPRYSAASSGADYNGHPLEISFNPLRRHWSAHYYWGQFVWLAHGSLEKCLKVCVRHYDESPQRGTCILVGIDEEGDAPESVEEQVALCLGAGLEEGRGPVREALGLTFDRSRAEPDTGSGPGM